MNEGNELILRPKDQFVNNIKQWVTLDTQLKLVNEKTKKIRETKHELMDNICKYMTENDLAKNKIKISDGELRVYEKKEYSPLTYGYIEKTLKNIIQNEEQVDYIIQYLKENREVATSLYIRRTYNKV